MAWTVILHPAVEEWFLQLSETDPKSADLVEQSIDLLVEIGPTLGRPLADRVRGARHHAMKELRPPTAGSTTVRILFGFDTARQAILLAAGDKSGRWKQWYEINIPIADQRWYEWEQEGRWS